MFADGDAIPGDWDGPCEGEAGVGPAVFGRVEAPVEEVGGFWEKLCDGAKVIEDFGPAPWAPGFGMLTDRFGVTWILDVESGY